MTPLLNYIARVILIAGATANSLFILRADCSELTELNPGEQRVCLSLRVLSQRVTVAIHNGSEPDADCLNLAGIGYIEGYFIDRNEPPDIVLFGIRSNDRPNLRLDDLILNVRARASNLQFPYCSLDPIPENINALQTRFKNPPNDTSSLVLQRFLDTVVNVLGPQLTVIGNVPRESRLAHVMIDADYHMKKVSQGRIALQGVTSYLDFALNDAISRIKSGNSTQASGASMSRFWFRVGPGSPTFRRGSDIIAIRRCEVRVLTEKQKVLASGELADDNEDDPHGEAFAADLTKFLAIRWPTVVTLYHELENLYRLQALSIAMDFQSAFSAVSWNASSYLAGYKYRDELPMDSTMPPIGNLKVKTLRDPRVDGTTEYFLFPMVFGGVDMKMDVSEANFERVPDDELVQLKRILLQDRVHDDLLYWVTNAR